MSDETLLEVNNLKVHFGVGGGGLFNSGAIAIKAVDNVSFSINRGETLGLVGESGSGKTTVGRAILRALKPTDGNVKFYTNDDVIEVTALEGNALFKFRQHMQLIFQDPYSSLNPRMTVRDIIAEPLECQKYGTRKEIDARVQEVAERCKLNVEHMRRFPHAFSGGQRQR